MSKRLEITQDLCDKVKKLAQKKLTNTDIASVLNIGRTTVARIKEARFNAESYKGLNADRRDTETARNQKEKGKLERFLPMEKLPLAQQSIQTDNLEECTGQISMELPEEKKPVSYEDVLQQKAAEDGLDERDKKLMRFEAALTDKIRGDIQNIGFENIKAIYELKGEVGKIRDMLSQILRRKDK